MQALTRALKVTSEVAFNVTLKNTFNWLVFCTQRLLEKLIFQGYAKKK